MTLFSKIVPETEFKTWLHSVNFHDLNGHESDKHLYLVIRKLGDQFAVHRYNSETNGYFAGYYLNPEQTEEQALEKFCKLKKTIRYGK